jgi:hypothetical protein
MREVNFDEFNVLARRRGLTVDSLTELFRGRFGNRGDVRDLFERVFQKRYAATVIPYRCVIEFFEKELGFHQEEAGSERRCACGCGARVFDRRKWASNACRQRGHRQRVTDSPNLPEKPLYLLGRNVTVLGGQLPLPSRYGSRAKTALESTQSGG